METSNKKLTPKERQANVDALIHRLVKTKREIITEIQNDFEKPEFQATLQKLREKNAR